MRSVLATITAAGAAGAVALGPCAAGAQEHQMPGMCMGRTDPLMVLNAHTTGSRGSNGVPKFILNLETGPGREVTGVLIVGQGEDRVHVDQLCRFWQHMPGQEPGEGHEGGGHGDGMGEVPEGATVAHAVGIGSLSDGVRVLVRADVRETDEGRTFRVRYRAMGQHGEDGHAEDSPAQEPGADDGHDDEAWTRIPAEGWFPLDQLRLRPAEA